MKVFIISLFITILSLTAEGQQLVLPGAHPDPSVTKIGDTYWATATSSNWFPAFPLMYSKDLKNWKQSGYIFSQKPKWTDYYFWAPEISYDSGKVYVYYTAHSKNYNLCVGVASADKPEGPYTDHGPLMCQENGSIDAFPIRDTSGKLYLVWKEDANSVGLPTPIFVQEINKERTALTGDRTEIFRNDRRWEKELVEGVSVIRHGDYFYAFYAAAGCCGNRCTYLTGVARSKGLLGPWEKDARNPILTDDTTWLCKGHGTPVEKDGRYYFLYHAYDKKSSAFTGREGLLQEFRFTDDNWIEFLPSKAPQVERKEIIRDEFDEKVLKLEWQWNVFKNINYKIKDDALHLSALPDKTGSFIGQKIVSANYTATTVVMPEQTTASAGIAAIGDEDNMLALLFNEGKLQLLKVQDGNDTLETVVRIRKTDKVFLRMSVSGPYRILFSYSLDGNEFVPVNLRALRGAYLPPWDSPPRAGLTSIGAPDKVAVFDRFELRAGALNSTQLYKAVGKKLVKQLLLFLVLPGILISGLVYFVKHKKNSERATKALSS